MTLAVHRLAGAAVALAAGGTIIFGSLYLVGKSHIPPFTRTKSSPSGNVLYFHTYKTEPGRPVNGPPAAQKPKTP